MRKISKYTGEGMLLNDMHCAGGRQRRKADHELQPHPRQLELDKSCQAACGLNRVWMGFGSSILVTVGGQMQPHSLHCISQGHCVHNPTGMSGEGCILRYRS